MNRPYRIGVYQISHGSAWHGGQIYFDNLVSLLRDSSQDPVELVIIETERGAEQSGKFGENDPTIYFEDYFALKKKRVLRIRNGALQPRTQAEQNRRKTRWWHRFLRRTRRNEEHRRVSIPKINPSERLAFASMVKDCKLDFVFPLPPHLTGPGVIGADWIPDLQHCFLPEFFDQSDIESRNEAFSETSKSGIIVFSSKSARDDFRKWYPDAAARLEVWSFCGHPGESLSESNPSRVLEKYRLPERFFLVANQFWKHKDHALVVEALVLLKNEGLDVKAVFTGALRDYRGTGHVDEFLQSIQRGGIHNNVHLLGFLDRGEQWQLMRSALAVVQPSRFEGWSTVVEDCKAIGQRLILSDLAVHVEQAPKDSVYFPVGESRLLADKIRELWTDGAGEWLQSRETRESQGRSALTQARAATRRRFLEIVESAQSGRV